MNVINFVSLSVNFLCARITWCMHFQNHQISCRDTSSYICIYNKQITFTVCIMQVFHQQSAVAKYCFLAQDDTT